MTYKTPTFCISDEIKYTACIPVFPEPTTIDLEGYNIGAETGIISYKIVGETGEIRVEI